MEHLLFAAYLILFAGLITKVQFFKNSGLTSSQLIIAFFLKVIAGIFYGWIGVYYGNLAQMVDTWSFHYESLKEYQLLKTAPVEFFSNFLADKYHNSYANFLSSHNSWWNDLHWKLFIKFLALFNVLSFGHYYINVIFYSFITLFGAIAIYRVMMDVFPQKRLLLLAATFLVPSFLYWTSGLHKDGLTFLGLALITYHLYFGFKEATFKVYRIFLILLGAFLILIIRNYLLIILIPAVIAWSISRKLRWKPIVTFCAVYGIFIFLFFNLHYINPKLNFPQAVVIKQQDFLQLHGGSYVPVTRLQPSFISFVKTAPQALNLAVLRPYPSDVKQLLSLAAAVEIGFLWLLFIVFLFYREKIKSPDPFLFFCIFFAFSTFITIGYTVNFVGAIVRYRSVVWPFVIVPMVALIDWNRIGNILAGTGKKAKSS